MKKAVSYAVVLLPALVALPCAQMSSAAGATRAVRHTVIAATGGVAPTGGNYGPFAFLNTSLNARHQIAFDALVIGPQPTFGVFVGDGTTTSTIALGVNPDPAGPSFGFVFEPSITPNGDVIFDVNQNGTFRSDGETIVALAQDGDPAPGGGTLTPQA